MNNFTAYWNNGRSLFMGVYRQKLYGIYNRMPFVLTAYHKHKHNKIGSMYQLLAYSPDTCRVYKHGFSITHPYNGNMLYFHDVSFTNDTGAITQVKASKNTIIEKFGLVALQVAELGMTFDQFRHASTMNGVDGDYTLLNFATVRQILPNVFGRAIERMRIHIGGEIQSIVPHVPEHVDALCDISGDVLINVILPFITLKSKPFRVIETSDVEIIDARYVKTAVGIKTMRIRLDRSYHGHQKRIEVAMYEDHCRIMAVYRYVAGLKDGRHIRYNANGVKISEINYSTGKQHGNMTTWYDSGKTETLSHWVDGIEHGPTAAWYDNAGNTIKDMYHIVDGYLEGLCESFHWNGNIQERYTYVNHLIAGAYNVYRSSGSIKCKKLYSDGMLNGAYVEYYKSGRPKMLCNYINDVAGYQYFYRTNDRLSHIQLENDNGVTTSFASFNSKGIMVPNQNTRSDHFQILLYHENGEIATCITHAHGILNGPQVEYDPNGEIRSYRIIRQ